MRTPTRWLAILGLLTLALPAAAEPGRPGPADPAAFRQRGGPEGFGPGFGRHPDGRPVIALMLRNREALGLTPEQVQRLEQLRLDFARDAIRRGADLRVAEVDLMALRQAEPADLVRIEAKLREIERLRADLRLARIRTIETGKAQLTPDQRAKLRTLLAEPWPPFRGRPSGPRAEPGARSL